MAMKIHEELGCGHRTFTPYKTKGNHFTFPGLGFHDCEMRMMVPAPLLGDMRKRSNVFQTVWKKYYVSTNHGRA